MEFESTTKRQCVLDKNISSTRFSPVWVNQKLERHFVPLSLVKGLFFYILSVLFGSTYLPVD